MLLTGPAAFLLAAVLDVSAAFAGWARASVTARLRPSARGRQPPH
jgi:hypothetical protein